MSHPWQSVRITRNSGRKHSIVPCCGSGLWVTFRYCRLATCRVQMETKHGGDIAPSSERYEQTTAEYEAIVAQKEQANSELVSCLASGDKLAVAKSLATLGRRSEVKFASHA